MTCGNENTADRRLISDAKWMVKVLFWRCGRYSECGLSSIYSLKLLPNFQFCTHLVCTIIERTQWLLLHTFGFFHFKCSGSAKHVRHLFISPISSTDYSKIHVIQVVVDDYNCNGDIEWTMLLLRRNNKFIQFRSVLVWPTSKSSVHKKQTHTYTHKLDKADVSWQSRIHNNNDNNNVGVKLYFYERWRSSLAQRHELHFVV